MSASTLLAWLPGISVYGPSFRNEFCEIEALGTATSDMSNKQTSKPVLKKDEGETIHATTVLEASHVVEHHFSPELYAAIKCRAVANRTKESENSISFLTAVGTLAAESVYICKHRENENLICSAIDFLMVAPPGSRKSQAMDLFCTSKKEAKQ